MSQVENIISIKSDIKKILDSLKKHNLNRVYAEDYAENKRKKVTDLFAIYEEAHDIVLKATKSENLSSIVKEREIVEDIIFEINIILDNIQNKIDLAKSPISLQVEVNDTNMNFDFKIALQIVPDFLGESDKALDFIDAAKFYNDSLNADGKSKLLNFLIKIKLKEKAKSAFTYISCSDFDQFENLFIKRFGPKKNVATINSELAKLKQGQDTITQFAGKIEVLTHELSNVQISTQGISSAEVIRKINDEIALNYFKQGLNASVKNVVFAARVKSFAEAVSLAQEVESENAAYTANVHFAARGGNKNSGSRGNRGRNNSSRRGGHRNNSGSQSNYGNQDDNECSSGNYQRNTSGDHQNSSRGNSRGNYRGNFNSNHYRNDQAVGRVNLVTENETAPSVQEEELGAVVQIDH